MGGDLEGFGEGSGGGGCSFDFVPFITIFSFLALAAVCLGVPYLCFIFLKYNFIIFSTFSLRHGCCHCKFANFSRHFFVFGGGLSCFGSNFCSLCIPTSYFFSWSIHCATPEEEKTRRLRQRRTASQQRRLAERINF